MCAVSEGLTGMRLAELRPLFPGGPGGGERAAHTRIFLFSKGTACPSMNTSPSATCAISGSKLLPVAMHNRNHPPGPGLLRPIHGLGGPWCVQNATTSCFEDHDLGLS
jgi:hypothetical protein